MSHPSTKFDFRRIYRPKATDLDYMAGILSVVEVLLEVSAFGAIDHDRKSIKRTCHEWYETDEGYVTDHYVSVMASRFLGPAIAKERTVLSPSPPSKSSATAAPPNPTSNLGCERFLQLMYHELAGINQTLRIISNVKVSGSRKTAQQSVNNLLNTEAAAGDEHGQFTHTYISRVPPS